MKKVAILILLALNINVFGQMPGGAPAGNAKQMNMGHVYGKVVDQQGKPVEFASVILLKTTIDPETKKPKDVLLKGQTTELNGDFSLIELPIFGKLKLKVTSVGYKPLEMPISFEMKMDGKMGAPKTGGMPDPSAMAKMLEGIDKDLGNLKMTPDETNLEGVTVTASKALLEMDIDKKTFNVDKNIVTTGGTAVDIMRNIPSIQVDIDGNVKLRNASPLLYIDGRPTTLSLDQIPADAIEKVEVITNPSAKYDASGSNVGILNLVLKKNKKSGYNGMVNAGADKNGGSNLLGSFNVRQNKINVTAMAMNNRMRNKTFGNSVRESNISDVNSVISQDINNRNKGAFSFGRLGLDYFVTNRTTLSASGTLVNGKFRPTENIDITNTRSNFTTLSNRISNTEREFKAKGLQLGLKHNFPSKGEELTLDFNYFGGKNNSSSIYNTNYLNNTNAISGTQIQKNIGVGSNKFMTFQTDYVKPFSETFSLETGLKAQINILNNKNNNTIKSVGSEIYKNVSAASTNYESQNNVYAAYASVSGKAKKLFSYKVGLRAESSNYDGKLLNNGDTFTNSYPLSLFPSVFLSKELTKTDQIQMSITRRVNRPNFFQLIPFIDYSDSLNITRGNAGLVPEFTTASEISYSKSKGTSTFLSSIYYKHTNDLITRYLQQDINPVSGKTDLINTYVNANSSDTYGMEFTYTNKVQKWWDLTANINFYNSKINTSNIDKANNSALWTTFGKLNNNFTLPKKWTIQLSGDYQGKTNLPITQAQGFGPPMSQAQSSSQGYIEPFYGVDMAVKKTFLKKDLASVTLAMNDIFRTRGNTQYSTGEGFTQTYYRLNNPQMIKLNLSIRFGQMDMSLFKRQNTKNSGGAMEGVQMN
jgi:ferric enterobactin receptor